MVSQESVSWVGSGGGKDPTLLAGKSREEQKQPKNSWKILKNIIILKLVVIVSNMFKGCFLGFYPPNKKPWGKCHSLPFFSGAKFFGSCELKRRATIPELHLVELVVFFPSEKAPSWRFRSKIPSWELTYSLKSPFWRWCSFSPGGIC